MLNVSESGSGGGGVMAVLVLNRPTRTRSVAGVDTALYLVDRAGCGDGEIRQRIEPRYSAGQRCGDHWYDSAIVYEYAGGRGYAEAEHTYRSAQGRWIMKRARAAVFGPDGAIERAESRALGGRMTDLVSAEAVFADPAAVLGAVTPLRSEELQPGASFRRSYWFGAAGERLILGRVDRHGAVRIGRSVVPARLVRLRPMVSRDDVRRWRSASGTMPELEMVIEAEGRRRLLTLNIVALACVGGRTVRTVTGTLVLRDC